MDTEAAPDGPGEHAKRRRALVTGGARGLGRAFAEDLAGNGWDVAVIDLDLEGYREFPEEPFTEPVIDRLRGLGADAVGFTASVTDAAGLERIVSELGERWGGLDGVVCNAGGGSGELDGNRASTVGIDELREMFERNLIGTVTTVQASLDLLRASTAPSIVTMSSLNGIEPTATGSYAHYGVAKAAVAQYSRYLAKDLGPDGIRVNCLAPGPIGTGRLLRRMGERPDANREVVNALGRLGTPSDVAPLVRFLLEPGSAYLTGQVIRIDGGL